MMQLHWEMENHYQHIGRAGFGMLGYDPRNNEISNHQKTFPFAFDKSANICTRQALLEELPRHIAPDGIRFRDFFDSVANESPATKQMLGEQISELTLAKELELRNADGKVRRNGVHIHNDDIIIRPRQRLLLPPR